MTLKLQLLSSQPWGIWNGIQQLYMIRQEKKNKTSIDPIIKKDISDQMRDVIDFEKQLAEITIPASDRSV